MTDRRQPCYKAVKIYYYVRDTVWYDPYSPFYLPEHYRASRVLKRGRGFCVPKASLLCAMGRALSIPSRVGFATVRNHLATRQLIEFVGSDRFVCHAYTEFFLQGKLRGLKTRMGKPARILQVKRSGKGTRPGAPLP